MNPAGPYFIGFLLAVVLVYYLVPNRFQNHVISITSVGLLAWIDLWFAGAFLVVTFMNFYAAIWIDSKHHLKQRHQALLLSILGNIALLVAIKYSNIFHRIGDLISNWLGSPNPIPALNWILPLGFSYYMFQALGYQFEVYRKSHPAEKSLINFTAFLGFFPKIFAGPLERSTGFLPALKTSRVLEYDNFSHGFRLILWGAFKFIVISNWIGSIIEAAYIQDSEASGFHMIFSMVLYTLQVYTEFSGYTDIALGSGRLFGFQLTQNFRQPFLAKSLSDFWRRWHISLSTWVMDYIYTPLSLWISLRISPGKWGIMTSIFISFLLLGIWHGSSWNFVIFGMIQGTILAIEILSLRSRKKHLSNPLGRLAGHISTMAIFVVSAQFFKTNDYHETLNWFRRALDFSNSNSSLIFEFNQWPTYHLIAILIFFVFDQFVVRNNIENWLDKRNAVLRWLFYALQIYAIIAGTESSVQPLIYQGF